MTIELVPVELRDANRFIAEHHRHHRPVQGHRFSMGGVDETGALRGVIVIGRPVGRRQDDKRTVEVTRLCTDGTRNLCSMLYGAAVRAAFAIGYSRVITYTLASESGASLLASGARLMGTTPGGSWDKPSRRRSTHEAATLFDGPRPKYAIGPRNLWEWRKQRAAWTVPVALEVSR